MRYTKELLDPIVKESVSMTQVLKKLGLKLAGGNHSHLKSVIIKYGIDASHFTGKSSNKGLHHKGGNKRRTLDQIFIIRDQFKPREKGHSLRRALIDTGIADVCGECGIGPIWNGKNLNLVPDHKNGRFWDCRQENLQLLCPNCHSQTPTFSGRNNGNKVLQNDAVSSGTKY